MTKMRRKKIGSDAAGTGRLRIVGGTWRGRLLPVAAVEGLRPTAERVRETLFNWLAARIEGAHCLDLCAGTGALGLEALSRGAAGATFIERSRTAAEALRRAASLLGAETAEIVQADSLRWLDAAEPRAFDIVFVDPPYASGMAADLCRLLQSRGWLASGALIYLEHEKRQARPELPAAWQVLKDKSAGNVRYYLLTADDDNGRRFA